MEAIVIRRHCHGGFTILLNSDFGGQVAGNQVALHRSVAFKSEHLVRDAAQPRDAAQRVQLAGLAELRQRALDFHVHRRGLRSIRLVLRRGTVAAHNCLAAVGRLLRHRRSTEKKYRYKNEELQI